MYTSSAPHWALIFLVRVAIACMVIATLLYVFWPTTLNLISEFLSLRSVLINLIKGYPGFDQDWFSIASLITIYAYLYGYLAVAIVTANVICHDKLEALYGADDRGQWRLLSSALVGRFDFSSHVLNRTNYRSMPSVIRAYSKSREGIGSVVLDVISIVGVSYIGYSSLQVPPSHGGLVARFIDAIMAGFWCYCIFSIFMWFILVFAAWFRFFGRNN